jgi:hypothetical protein
MPWIDMSASERLFSTITNFDRIQVSPRLGSLLCHGLCLIEILDTVRSISTCTKEGRDFTHATSLASALTLSILLDILAAFVLSIKPLF